jgi:glyoxylase-like metal-dependent hydrolase (beta-lactamase superfamily II)
MRSNKTPPFLSRNPGHPTPANALQEPHERDHDRGDQARDEDRHRDKPGAWHARILGAIDSAPVFGPITERIADGVWRHAGDVRRGMNVYLLEHDGGVTVFDAGTQAMTDGVREAAEELGGAKRVVLGHSHADHRGVASALGVPVLCHPDEVSDARGDGGMHYFDLDQIPVWWSRRIYPTLLRRWDGGPVEIADTVSEGDEVASFQVLHFPGHAPGLIGLWRERDRLAIVSDVIYMVDSLRLKRLPDDEAPVVPDRIWNHDHESAKASVRRLAALEPRTVWAGHAESLTGEPHQVRVILERAAYRA